MSSKPFAAAALVGLSAALVLSPTGARGASAPELNFQAQLLWAGDGAKPPEGKNFKPVEPAISKKLHELPLKWKSYLEVSRTNFTVAASSVRKVAVSERCQLEVRTHEDSTLEVKLIGKGKEVVKSQSLPEGDILVVGGNAPNDTAWLVVLRRLPARK